MPLALVSIGQTSALLVGGFDVSVGALMTMCVVTASYTMTAETSWFGLLPGALALVGRRTGDRDLQRDPHPRLPPPVDHRHARHVQHPRGRVAPAARPSRGPDQPRRHRRAERRVSASCRSPSSRSSSSLVLADVWLYRTRTGLALRAVGLDETSSRRLGMGTDRTVILAFVVCSVDGVARRLLPRRRGSDRLTDHRQPGAREHRRGRPRRGQPRGRQGIVRRDAAGSALPHR